MSTTLTKSKTLTNTHLAIATGILVLTAGAAAFAAIGIPQERLYSSISVTCHDGSRMTEDQRVQIVYRTATSTPQAGPGRPCFTAKEGKNIAVSFCEGTQNPITRKKGVDNFSISGRCEQPLQAYGYGYGYGYPALQR